MIKLSDKYLLSHKNGYFVIHEKRVAGINAVDAGKVTFHIKATYARLLGVHKKLKELGEDCNKAMQIFEKLMIESQKKAGREILAARAKKLEVK